MFSIEIDYTETIVIYGSRGVSYLIRRRIKNTFTSIGIGSVFAAIFIRKKKKNVSTRHLARDGFKFVEYNP